MGGMTEYLEARERVAERVAEADRFPGRTYVAVLPAHLRTLLAGPPEPSVEEVAMAWLDRSMPLPPPDSPLNVACRALVIDGAQRVQALYRSARAPQPDE